MSLIVYPKESYKINGAIYEVHQRLGIGLLEKVYQEAFEKELKYQNIPFEREKHYDLFYRGEKLDAYYIADFVCFDKIIVELKAVSELTNAHKAQVRNYLGITGRKLGLLVNFNQEFVTPIRILNSTAN